MPQLTRFWIPIFDECLALCDSSIASHKAKHILESGKAENQKVANTRIMYVKLRIAYLEEFWDKAGFVFAAVFLNKTWVHARFAGSPASVGKEQLGLVFERWIFDIWEERLNINLCSLSSCISRVSIRMKKLKDKAKDMDRDSDWLQLKAR